ncbi:MAG: ABC transporter permease [Oscillospiraceae bacterium]|nr:ABC transporter permease [Oscillospiraceae bacterium]
MIKSRYPAFPYIAFMAIFIVVPLVMVAYFAFTTSSGEFTFQNIIRVGDYAPVIVKSLFLAFVATAICLFLGYPFAYIMSRKTSNIRSTMFMLIMLPMWMNFLLRTYSWMTILENNGLLNRFLEIFGIGPFEMINTQGAVVLGMVYDYLPFMIVPLYTVMMKMDHSLIQAAQDLGANPIQVFTNVTLPQTVQGIKTGITMVFVPSVSTFVISRMLGGGSELMVGDLIEMQFGSNNYNPNLGSAISLVLMIIVLICMSVMNQFDSENIDKEGRIAI